MKNRSFCNQSERRPATEEKPWMWVALLSVCVLALAWPSRAAADAPGWMHALASASVPAHDDKTDAVEMYSERIVTVQSADKIKTLVREAYKIVRPGGRDLAVRVQPRRVGRGARRSEPRDVVRPVDEGDRGRTHHSRRDQPVASGR